MASRPLYYPKIHGCQNFHGQKCIAFEKIDGSNLHWVWDRDFGWHAFGTRRDRFNLLNQGIKEFEENHPSLASAVDVFQRSLAADLEKIFTQGPSYQAMQEWIVFTEFHGPSSFAGSHRKDEPKTLTLLDVMNNNQGFVEPTQFLSDFGELAIAKKVYEGRLTGKFADDVREGLFDVEEGVICKGTQKSTSATERVWRAKIKTYSYMEKLKKSFANNWKSYWE